MWRVLARLGVPGNLITIISFFHSDMTASTRVGGDLLAPIRVENGLLAAGLHYGPIFVLPIHVCSL